MKKELPKLGVYPITTDTFDLSHIELAKRITKADIQVLQFREKRKNIRDCIQIGKTLRQLTKKRNVSLIVNDRVDIAQAIDADGVHLGQNDMPLSIARAILGKEKIIGASAETIGQAKEAEDIADYLGVGTVFPTTTKQNAGAPIGLQTLQRISRRVDIPVVGIGGITLQNVKEVIKHGADGVAVISTIAQSRNPFKTTQKLIEKVQLAKKEFD